MEQIEDHYDVVVVGAGPAGSALATLLAQRGRSVLVLEKEEFPRFHVGESLISGMVPLIRQLGLEEEMDRRFQWKYGVTLLWGNDPEPWRTAFGEASPFDHSWHVDRASFDHLLLQTAEKHGVRVLQRARVGKILTRPDGRVEGVRFTEDGHTRDVFGRYVVDASGQSRLVSRGLTPLRWEDDLKNVGIWRYYDGYEPLPDAEDIMIEAVPGVGGWLWGIPLSDERLSVGYVVHTDVVSRALSAGRTTEDLYEAALAASTQAARMVAPARQHGGQHTARDFSHAAEQFAGPGWLAVGDSAAFVDPLFSSGVWLGTSGAWLASISLDACLEDEQHEELALRRYEELYRRIVGDMLAYVRYFSDPHRDKEDYLQKAEAAAQVYSEDHQIGFISLISGLTALPFLLEFDPLADERAA
jgi:flavin-dependent dehydrogenase